MVARLVFSDYYEFLVSERCAKPGEIMECPQAGAEHQEVAEGEGEQNPVPLVVSCNVYELQLREIRKKPNHSGSNSPPGPYFDFIIMRYPSSLQGG